MTLWPHLLDLVEDEEDLIPGKEKQWHGRNVTRVVRNPIDLAYTVVEIKDNMFCINMPLGKDFKPENLDVKIKDRHAIITIRTEQQSEDGTSHLSQVFTKKIPFPDEAKLAEVKSLLTHEGVLKIRAPLPEPEGIQQREGMDIPIAIELQDKPPPA